MGGDRTFWPTTLVRNTRWSKDWLVLGTGGVASVALILAGVSVTFGAVTETGEVRQPRNIHKLVYAFDHTFRSIPNNDELRLYHRHTPQEIRRLNPELYARMSVDVKRWTDEWIQHILTTGDPIPERKLEVANQVAGKVEAILRRHFDERRWPYRPMRVVFIPPRAFQDDRKRGKSTGGMFIPYYPDACFATIDWKFPIETLLIHERLHFNAEEPPSEPTAS